MDTSPRGFPQRRRPPKLARILMMAAAAGPIIGLIAAVILGVVWGLMRLFGGGG
jgi:uncharacterized protein involved in exopolysaccharide biosynthesis